MKTVIALIVLGMGTAFAQGDVWNARESSELSVTSVPGGTQSASKVTQVRVEKTCPPASSWDYPPMEENWNTIELGVALDKPFRSAFDTEPRIYTRYTCTKPIDMP